MKDFFSKQFYGNTIETWLIALSIILGGFLLAKLIYYFLSKVVKKLTTKTKSKLDTLIIDMIEEPIMFGVIILSLWYGINYLELPKKTLSIVGKAYYILITFNVAWFISRFLDALIKEYLTPKVTESKSDIDDQLLPILRKGIKVVIWIIAIIVGLNNAGYDVGALIAGLGLGGLAFAMAAKDSLANLFGGFTVFTDKPFTIHDRIIVKGFDGTVEEIGIRSTRLKTQAGRIVTMPNAIFSSEAIENITSEPGRKTIINLGLVYDTSPEKMQNAIQILKEIADETQGVLKNDVVASFIEYGDSSLNIRFSYYIEKSFDIFETTSNVNLEILKRFNKAGLVFAFPTRTIYNASNT
jgi:MscS family membrane protein